MPWLKKEEASRSSCSWSISSDPWLRERGRKSASFPVPDRWPVTPRSERRKISQDSRSRSITSDPWLREKGQIALGYLRSPVIPAGRFHVELWLGLWYHWKSRCLSRSHFNSLWQCGMDGSVTNLPYVVFNKAVSRSWVFGKWTDPFTANLDRTTHMAPSLCCYFSVTVANNAILFFSLLPNCV